MKTLFLSFLCVSASLRLNAGVLIGNGLVGTTGNGIYGQLTLTPLSNPLILSNGNLAFGVNYTISLTNGGFTNQVVAGNYALRQGPYSVQISMPDTTNVIYLTNIFSSGLQSNYIYAAAPAVYGTKVDSNDLVAGFLSSKLIFGAGFNVVTNNPGTNESLTITNTGSGSSGGSSSVHPNWINIKLAPYSAMGDGIALTNVTMASNSIVLTCANATFVSGDVGKLFVVAGAGAGSNDLCAPISVVYSNTGIGLALVCQANGVTNVNARYATDDSIAITNAYGQMQYGTNTHVYFPPGNYGWRTAFTVPTQSQNNGFAPTLEVSGEGPAYLNPASPNHANSTFTSHLWLMTNGGPDMLAASSSAARNWVNFYLHDFAVRAPVNPTNSLFKLGWSSSANVERLEIDVGQTEYGQAFHYGTTPTAVALEMPFVNSAGGGNNQINMFLGEGYSTILSLSEHATVLDAACVLANRGIEMHGSYHDMDCYRLVVESCKTNVAVLASACRFMIDHFDIENDAAFGLPTTYDIDDPNNYGQAEVNWVHVAGGVGIDHVFAMNGGAGIITHELGRPVYQQGSVGISNAIAMAMVYPTVQNFTNVAMDFSTGARYITLTNDICFSNTLNAVAGFPNQSTVYLSPGASPRKISWAGLPTLSGPYTTNGLSISNTAGWYVMNASQQGTSGAASNVVYSINVPNGGPAAPPADYTNGLKLWYKTIEGDTTSTLTDFSVNQNNLGMLNTPAIVTGLNGHSALQWTAASSQAGATTSTLDLSALNVVTFAFWANFPSYDTLDGVFLETSANYNTSDGTFFITPDDASGWFVGEHHSGGATGITDANFAQVSSGAWHHYAIEFNCSVNPNTMTVYIDGASVSVSYLSQNTITSNFGNFTLVMGGRNRSSLFINATWQDFRVYPELVSGANVAAIANTANAR